MNHFVNYPGRVAEGDAQYLYKDLQLHPVNHFCPKVVLSWPHMYDTGLRMSREDNLVWHLGEVCFGGILISNVFRA